MRAFLDLTESELAEKWQQESHHFSGMRHNHYRLERIYSRLAEIEGALWSLNHFAGKPGKKKARRDAGV